MSRRVWTGSAALVALLILFPILATLGSAPHWITIGTKILIVSIAVISLDLVLGYAGLPSFGHAAFFGLGAYTVAIAAQHAVASPAGSWLAMAGNEALISIVAAMLVSSAAGAVIGAMALRTRGVHFLMITLAFSQMIYYLFVSLPSYGADEGIRMKSRQLLLGLDLSDPIRFYAVCACALLGTFVTSRMLVQSRFGRVLSGCKQNERRMRFLGYRTNGYLLAAFVISSAGTGLAGALMANHQRFVSPNLLSWFQSGEFMIMNILGGLGSAFGGILGAAVFIILHEILNRFTERWEVILGAGLLVLVLASPGGLSRGLFRFARNAGRPDGR
ncbi:MAG: branched-chain amino acid ABC transporter permease [Betaproteobacteria bacterium]|nr:branched-chain amino acid ABC transporter permease [Betaproteobacteria bacterium]